MNIWSPPLSSSLHSHYIEVDRPSWTDYFLGLAFCVAERSEDSETKHGSVLTDRSNHIIGTGYNSPPRGISKGLLPINTREDPRKHPHYIHSEENALLNTIISPWLIPEGGVAYITACPCLRCLYKLWNSNITTIYYPEADYYFKNYENEREDFDKFVNDVKIEINVVTMKPDWLLKPIKRLGL